MKDYQVVPNFRIRTIPVFGALPAIFGMACAAHVVTSLAGQPFDSEPIFRVQKQQYDTQLERLREREDNREAEEGSMGVDLQVSHRSTALVPTTVRESFREAQQDLSSSVRHNFICIN
jgi:hypothetical protein